PAQRTTMRTELRESGLDFGQVYERDSSAWRLTGTVVPVGVLAAMVPQLGDSIPGAMAGDRLIRATSGILAAVAPVRDGVAMVTGVRLNAGYWEELDQVRQAREFYARVGVLVDVQRQRVWLTISALVLAIALGAALLARALAKGMTQPLSRLSTALERVEDGISQAALPETGPRELASLATSFNAMTARHAASRTSSRTSSPRCRCRTTACRSASSWCPSPS